MIAVFATVVIYPITLLTRKLSSKLVNRRQIHRIFIVFQEEHEKQLYETLANNGVVVNKTYFHNKQTVEGINLKEVYIYMKASKKYTHEELLEHLASYEWIKTIENA